MFRNLNPVAFQNFGYILSDRRKDKNTPEIAAVLNLAPEQTAFPVYRAGEETCLRLSRGKSILSVSTDGESFLHFYFDKPVCIKTDVYFCLSPFKGSSVIDLSAAMPPAAVGQRSGASLRLNRKLRVDGIYTFFYQEREQGFLFPGEEHPMPELTYVDQGELHCVADGQDILLKQGDIAILAPDQWHMQYAEMGIAPRFVTITFDLEGLDITPLLNRKFTAPQQAVTLIQQMLQEQERMDGYSTDMMITQLSALILTLLRHADTPGDKVKASNAIRAENDIVRRAQQHISAHVRQKLSVPIVARMTDVSPSYLTALFHKHLQISPGEYIRRIKLQESKQMIREGDLNFTEIAAALQYSTVHHFSRQFKEKFGITPSEYAKSVR